MASVTENGVKNINCASIDMKPDDDDPNKMNENKEPPHVNDLTIELNNQVANEEIPQQIITPPPRRYGRSRPGSLRKSKRDHYQIDGNHHEPNLCAPLTQICDNNHRIQVDAHGEFNRSIQLENSNDTIASPSDKSLTPVVVCHDNSDQIITCDSTSRESAKREYREETFSVLTQRLVNRAVSELQLMDKLRRWKIRWITSDDAKAARRRRLNNIKYYLKVFFAHLFSTAGLCSLVVLYSILGAVTFEWLESRNEFDSRMKVANKRKDCALELWNLTNKLNVLFDKNWTAEAIILLKNYESEIIKSVRNDGYDGKDFDNKDTQWSFSGALLYSVTVITTIGYGNVTCKTMWGRIATIIYALLGIPIMFLCLANLGNLMANTFRFSYRRICCICFCCYKKSICRRIMRKKSKEKMESVEMKNCNSNNKMPNHASQKDMRVYYDENEDVKVTSQIVTPQMQSPVSPVSPQLSPTTKSLKPDASKQNLEIHIMSNRTVTTASEGDRVPIWLVLLIVIGYIFGGTMWFCLWEDWNPLEGAYFCFITLTTIGFGDYVPGRTLNTNEENVQVNLVICCAYLVIGLSLLAMSFNLVQEAIVIRCREIALRLGILPQKVHEQQITDAV